jgi:hypothetical protein
MRLERLKSASLIRKSKSKKHKSSSKQTLQFGLAKNVNNPKDLQELDTQKVAQTFKNYLIAHNISQRALSKQTGFTSERSLQRLLNNPKVWKNCKKFAKRMYQYNAENNATPLDTESIAKKVNEVLREYNITMASFVKKYLGITRSQARSIMDKPKRWKECSEFQRGFFRCMHERSMCEDQVASLAEL